MPYSSARTAPPWIVVIHTGEGILNRFDMVRFLDNNPGASAHAASDAGGVEAPLVPDERAAWTAGYTANNAGLHIEMCAFAMLTREQWLSEADVTIYVPWVKGNRTIRSPRSMVRHTAAWAREKCDRWGIPRQKVSASDLRAGRGGICGHADTSAAWGETDHTDPGGGFPWDVFIADVNGTSAGGGGGAPVEDFEEEETVKETVPLGKSQTDALVKFDVDPRKECAVVAEVPGDDPNEIMYVVASFHWGSGKSGMGGNPIGGSPLRVTPGKPLSFTVPKGTVYGEFVYSTNFEGATLTVYS